jgi:glycosyltransferase involved in cell wall biosynthesis
MPERRASFMVEGPNQPIAREAGLAHMPINASVVVCTYNRCDSLADTLASLRDLIVPDGLQWEIVVVDNNSKDRTRQVVEQFAAVSPTKTSYLFEPTQGLSYARNRAVNEAAGELIVFTDDDVLVDPGWLRATLATFAATGADCVGGKVLPRWLGQRPRWLGNSLLNVLAMLDYGDELVELGQGGDDRCLYGANLAFKRDRLIELGAFNPELGRRGNFGAGEDKEIQERLRASGGKVIYEPRSVVNHKVDPTRLSKGYFRHWYYSAGKDRALTTKPSGFLVFGIESYLLRAFARTAVRLLAAAAALNWSRFFELELHCILYLSVFRHKLALSLHQHRKELAQ